MNWEAWLLGLAIIVVGLTLLGTVVILAVSVVARLVFGPRPAVEVGAEVGAEDERR